jgi:hypothetical protein
MLWWSLSAREIVVMDTPSSRAKSAMETGLLPALGSFEGVRRAAMVAKEKETNKCVKLLRTATKRRTGTMRL